MTFFLESIYATFKTHYEIMRGPSHAPEPVCLQSSASTHTQTNASTSLQSSAPTPTHLHSHATTPLNPHAPTPLQSSAPTPLQSSTPTPLHPHALTSLHPHKLMDLHSTEPADSQSHATTPSYPHELRGLHSTESAELYPHGLMCLHSTEPATTPLFPSETTCLQSSIPLCSILLKNVLPKMQKAIDKNFSGIKIFDYCLLLHVCYRMGSMSLETVAQVLKNFIVSNFHEYDDVRNQIVDDFVNNLRNFYITQSEYTFTNMVFSMEPLDVIYSISYVNKLMYSSLSLVNDKVNINYGIHKPESVPCITLRQRLYPKTTPKFTINK